MSELIKGTWFSPKETDKILVLLGDGKTTAQIARVLKRSERAVSQWLYRQGITKSVISAVFSEAA